MPQFGASLADDSRVVIYDRNTVQATGFVLLAKAITFYVIHFRILCTIHKYETSPKKSTG